MAVKVGGVSPRLVSGAGSSYARGTVDRISTGTVDRISTGTSASGVWDAVQRQFIDEFGGAAAMREGQIAAAGLTENPYIPGASSWVSDALNNLVNNLGSDDADKPLTSVSSDAGTSVPVPDYLYADLAKAYGMDVSTAYQEALSNTSYQRAVKDLQAAGLNPMLAATGLSGAGGVYGATVYGGNQSISTGVSSAKSSHTYYKALSQLGTLAGAGVGFFKFGGIKGAAMGASVGGSVLGAVGNLIDAL